MPRFRRLFRFPWPTASQVEQDVDTELRFHLDRRAEELVEQGMDPEQAHTEAVRQFGDLAYTRRYCRDLQGRTAHRERWAMLVDEFRQDVRYGVRILTKSPASTVAAVLTLALGIGANTAVFSVVRTVLVRPLPYADPERLVVALHGESGPVSPANFADWRDRNRVFDQMTATELWSPILTGREHAEQITGVRATESLFALLGAQPILGRTFLPGEDRAEAHRVVVLSHRLWQRRFGGDPAIVGQGMTLDGDAYTIVAIMPRSFRFPLFWARNVDLWAPLPLEGRLDNRGAMSLRVFARLKPDVTHDQAQREMDGIARALADEYPSSNTGLGVNVLSLRDKIVGDVQSTLLALAVAVGFVLLIACANVTNLRLARTDATRRELTLRVALGAPRGRLVRQQLTESLLLSVFGATVAWLLALVAVRWFAADLPASTLPRQDDIGLDVSMLTFTALLAVLTGLATGLWPALQASRTDLNDTLTRLGRRTTRGGTSRSLSRLLLVGQVATTLVLLVGAGLMVRSLVRLQAVQPGLDPRNLLTMTVSVAASTRNAPESRGAFFDEVLERIEAVPGVASASTVNHLPLAGDMWVLGFTLEGRPEPAPGARPGAVYRVARPGYFRTMGIPHLVGRDFTERDTTDTPAAVIVNETLARRYWPDTDPLGQRLKLGQADSRSPWMTVVGVVADVTQNRWAGTVRNEIYLPLGQERSYLGSSAQQYSYLTLVIRTTGEPTALASAVQDQIWAIDPNVSVSQVAAMEQVVSRQTWQPRISALLLGSLGLLALALAAVGLYGVLSYAVSRRTQEIGVRIAIGATPSDILWSTVAEGMGLTLAGLVLGLAASRVIARPLGGLLFEIEPDDPVTFGVQSVVLALVAFVACYLPARRATKVDPAQALRE